MAASALPSFAPRRPLGRTGFVATVIGVGDVADRTVPLEDCVATVKRALEAGLNLVDTAPGYEQGYSEQIVGKALEGRRDGVFVVDKIDHHDRPVLPQVEESLGRLGLDATDLFVLHGLSTVEGWHRAAAPGGSMEQLAECVAKGRTRFRGISSHHPDVLELAIESGLCDVVLFPLGPFCDERYARRVLPLARARGVGTVCFKTFGAGKLLGDTAGYGQPLKERPRGKLSSGGAASNVSDGGVGTSTLPRLAVAQCVSYTLTLDPDVALLGMSFPNEQDAALAAARAFAPLPPERMRQIRDEAERAMAGKGECWWDPPRKTT
jgi:aryl-alcohol dehydrogenase-like predicted oxidoreductase